MKLELLACDQRVTRRHPLLFVHGAWHGAWCWERFLPYFSDHGYAAYAVSLRGHGESEGRERVRLHSAAYDYVADVAAVVASLPTAPILVGHSMGGYVVQKYLEHRTAPAAVLLAPVPVSGIIGFGLRYLARYPWRLLRAHARLELLELFGTPALARQFLFSDVSEDELQRHFARLQPESFRVELETVALNLPRPKRVLQGRTPLLLLAAEQDRIFSVEEERKTAWAYGIEAEIFPQMAHDMMLEPDWHRVADRMLEWLDERGL